MWLSRWFMCILRFAFHGLSCVVTLPLLPVFLAILLAFALHSFRNARRWIQSAGNTCHSEQGIGIPDQEPQPAWEN